MKTNKILCLAALSLLFSAAAEAKTYNVSSPSGNVCISVDKTAQLTWSVSYDGKQILDASRIDIDVDGIAPIGSSRVTKVRTGKIDQMQKALVPVKFADIHDFCNELTISFSNGISLQVRAYDDGAAYRFCSKLGKKQIDVMSETSEWSFSDDCLAYWANEKNPDFITHCEADFKEKPLSTIEQPVYSYLPVSISTPDGVRAVITEADLFDYPNLFLEGGHGQTLAGIQPKVISAYDMRTDRDVTITENAPYIARTSGTRSFPWRVLTLGDDRSLLENTLPWQLSSPEIDLDWSWLKPGKISWEWWATLNVFGVDFEAGVNTDTYKYYIDFAAAYGLEYILLDEGWSASTLDILHTNPALDLHELIEYGRSKGVGVVLWALWTPLKADLENIISTYEQWGVAGIKMDFMQMNDQNMVRFYEQVAECCARHHLAADYHGAFKPAGLQRKYPNAMTYEGVYGMEHDKCSYDISPEHDLQLPFTRMVAGPMDYTPGAVNNGTQDDFRQLWYHPMSQGTRAHQAAIFICFESPLMMLCDSPSKYYQVPEYTAWLAAMPTVWDETVALEAKAGDYMTIARRRGDKWYVAGLNDWTGRDLDIDFSFLPAGKWNMKIFCDGVNADRWAEDYRIENRTVSAEDTIKIHMANGGGWAAILEPAE